MCVYIYMYIPTHTCIYPCIHVYTHAYIHIGTIISIRTFSKMLGRFKTHVIFNMILYHTLKWHRNDHLNPATSKHIYHLNPDISKDIFHFKYGTVSYFTMVQAQPSQSGHFQRCVDARRRSQARRSPSGYSSFFFRRIFF